MVTYNETYVIAENQELGTPISEITRTSVTLHFTPPSLSKTAFPETGTVNNNNIIEGGEVVKNSVIDYKLHISNPDDTLTVYNIVVEDTLQTDLTINNTVKVAMGDEDPVAINKSARISAYSIEDVAVDGDNRTKFTATIASLAPGETMTITVPATVNADNNTVIENTSYITGYNGMAFSDQDIITSETTYHVVADIKVKIKKVNSKGEGLAGASLQILNSDNSVKVDNITSTTGVMTFNIEPGDYILHEVSPPSDIYDTAADIPFTVDVEGICHVNNKTVNYVEMTDQPAYKVIFHENKPNGSGAEKQKEFKVFEPTDLENNKVPHFYDLPEWAGDEYVFAGWYSNADYTYLTGITNDNNTAKYALDFDNTTFTTKNSKASNGRNDYHVYAKWITVGSFEQDEEDTNRYDGTYRGFGIAGVQIRAKTGKAFNEETGQYEDATLVDDNIRDDDLPDSEYNDSAKPTPEGMRFVTSLSESLISSINGIGKITAASSEAKTFGVEYGYVVGTEANINSFVDHYQVKNAADYPLQYKGENVNGKNTTGETAEVDKDYRFITNVNCTSKQGQGTTNNNSGVVEFDHCNYADYRLYTLVVTYDDADSASHKGDKIAARAYIRYYDANGKLRVFYNTYKKSMFSGCLCSFNQAYAAIYG